LLVSVLVTVVVVVRSEELRLWRGVLLAKKPTHEAEEIDVDA